MSDSHSRLKAAVRRFLPHLSSDIEHIDLNDAVVRVCFATGHHLPNQTDDIERFAMIVINFIHSTDY